MSNIIEKNTFDVTNQNYLKLLEDAKRKIQSARIQIAKTANQDLLAHLDFQHKTSGICGNSCGKCRNSSDTFIFLFRLENYIRHPSRHIFFRRFEFFKFFSS